MRAPTRASARGGPCLRRRPDPRFAWPGPRVCRAPACGPGSKTAGSRIRRACRRPPMCMTSPSCAAFAPEKRVSANCSFDTSSIRRSSASSAGTCGRFGRRFFHAFSASVRVAARMEKSCMLTSSATSFPSSAAKSARSNASRNAMFGVPRVAHRMAMWPSGACSSREITPALTGISSGRLSSTRIWSARTVVGSSVPFTRRRKPKVMPVVSGW